MMSGCVVSMFPIVFKCSFIARDQNGASVSFIERADSKR